MSFARAWSAVLIALALSGGSNLRAADAPLEKCQTITDNAARLACFDALNKPAAKTKPAPDPVADRFGKPRVETPESSEPDALAARVVGTLIRWEKGTIITLENEQQWKVVGDHRGYYPNTPENPQVTITRSYFGAYWMTVEPAGNKIKVRRIK